MLSSAISVFVGVYAPIISAIAVLLIRRNFKNKRKDK